MKNNKRRIIALLLALIITFNLSSVVFMPKVEAVAGVDDVAMIALVTSVVAGGGYVITSNDGAKNLSNSIGRYIDDNFSSDSSVKKEYESVKASQLGGVIALESVKNLLPIIEKFRDACVNTFNREKTANYTASEMNAFSQEDILKQYPYIHLRGNSSPSTSKEFCASALCTPFGKYADYSGVKYCLYLYRYNYRNAKENKYITMQDGYYRFASYYTLYLCYEDSNGGCYAQYVDTYSANSLPVANVVSLNTGTLAINDLSANEGINAYVPSSSSVRLTGDGVKRALSPNIPVTTNNVSKIYEDAITGGETDSEALQRAIEALDNNNQVANKEISNILNQYLSVIIDKLETISVSLSNAKVDGTSALQLDDEAKEQFKVVQTGGNPDNNDDDNKPKWAKWATLAFLAPVIMALEDLLNSSGISSDILDGIKSGVSSGFESVKSGINSLIGAVNGILSMLASLPELIFDAFKDLLNDIKDLINTIIYDIVEILNVIKPAFESLVQYTAQILAQIQTFPQALADILADQLAEIEIQPIIEPVIEPAIEVNPLIDPAIEVNPQIEVNPNLDLEPLLNPLEEIIRLLKAILDAIKEFFQLDTSAIKANWDNHNNFSLNKYGAPFLAIPTNFDDEPPKIEVDTPSILRGFFDSDTIVIYDARDFDKYHKIIRMIVNAIIIVAYAYACINKFKVRFSM